MYKITYGLLPYTNCFGDYVESEYMTETKSKFYATLLVIYYKIFYDYIKVDYYEEEM